MSIESRPRSPPYSGASTAKSSGRNSRRSASMTRLATSRSKSVITTVLDSMAIAAVRGPPSAGPGRRALLQAEQRSADAFQCAELYHADRRGSPGAGRASRHAFAAYAGALAAGAEGAGAAGAAGGADGATFGAAASWP